MAEGRDYSKDPSVFLFTTLATGSRDMMTATTRLETILRANKIPFKYADIGSDDAARRVWGRRAGKTESGRCRMLPGLVQDGFVVGDILEVEDWNEYGELKEKVRLHADAHTHPPAGEMKELQPQPKLASTRVESREMAMVGEKDKTKENQHPDVLANLPTRALAEQAAQKAKVMKDAAAAAAAARGVAARAKEAVVEKSAAAAEIKTDSPGQSDSEPAARDKKETSTPVPTSKNVQIPSSNTPSPPSAHLTCLQSPTSGSWKDSGSGGFDSAVLGSVQSPTTTSWKRSHRGSEVIEVPAEEIQEIERREAIQEEEEEEQKGEAKDGAGVEDQKESEKAAEKTP